MKALDIFSYSFSAIKLRKLRAGLTTLGVVIGIAAIVALLSLSQGFQGSIAAQVQKGFATNTVIVSTIGLGLNQGGAPTTESDFKLFVNDTQTIDQIGNVTMSVAAIQKSGYLKVGNKTLAVSIVGVDFDKYAEIYSSTFAAESGSIPSSPLNETVVIGKRVNDPWENGTLFSNVNDQTEIIWSTRSGFALKNESYTGVVAAVLKEVGGFSLGGTPDSTVYIPLLQAQSFFGSDECNAIFVQLESDSEATIESFTEAIKEAFGDQVSVISSTAVLGTVSSLFSTIEIFLTGIAGISLLVAGVGIMNIMIVSLMERTREIGILKALGMKGRTVLLIFLGEAIIIGLMGAAIGIASGWGLANVFSMVGFSGMGLNPRGTGLTITPSLTPTVFFGAFAFGLLVSVVFGLYPAWRASKLKPVDALRYE
jgi:putative ABC transport system permease protein